MLPLAKSILPLLIVLAASCRQPAEDSVLPSERTLPPATAFESAGEAETLDGQLARLEAEIAAALETRNQDDLRARMMLAEAISDRLLEEEPPAEWLPGRYYVEARLRQLQSLADRVLARLTRGASPEAVRSDLEDLRSQVAGVREALRDARELDAPPPLDSLLADSAAARRSPSEAFAGVEGPAATAEQAGQAATTREQAGQPDPPGLIGDPLPDTAQ